MLDPGSFPCSSRLHSKLSPPFPGPRESPTAAGIRATGLGFGERNVAANCSPNADLSPKLESRPIYSTSFFVRAFSSLSSFPSRKVRIPFTCCLPRSHQTNRPHHPQAGELDQTLGSGPKLADTVAFLTDVARTAPSTRMSASSDQPYQKVLAGKKLDRLS